MYNKIKKFLSGKNKLESQKELVSGSRFLHSEYNSDQVEVLRKIADNAILFMGELPREINKNVKKSERGNFTRKFITTMNNELAAINPLLKKMETAYLKKGYTPKKYTSLEYELELNKLSELLGRPVSLYLGTDFMGAQGIGGLLRVGDDDFRLKLARRKSQNVHEAFTSLQINRAKQPGAKKTYLSVSENSGISWILSENLTVARAAMHKTYIPKLFKDNDTAIGNAIDNVYFDTGCFSSTKYNKMNWRERKEYRATVDKIMKNGMSPELKKKLDNYDQMIRRVMDSYKTGNNNRYNEFELFDRAITENPLKITPSELLEISVVQGLDLYKISHKHTVATPAKLFSDVDFAQNRFVNHFRLNKQSDR